MILHPTLARDTAPEVQAFMIERWRAMSTLRKAALVAALCHDTAELAAAGVRMRYPTATSEEIRLRTGALRVERELMIAAYGFDPGREGR